MSLARYYLVLILAFCIWHSYTEVNAQIPPKYSWGDRGDRYEGIAEKLVAVPTSLLFSAVVIHDEDISAKDASKFKLKFLLDEESEVFVTVRGYEKAYKMEPKKTSWAPADTSFSWPTKTVLKDYNIRLKDLGAVASIGNKKCEKVAPIALFVDNPPELVLGYEFTFLADTAVKISYKWVKADNRGPDREGTLVKNRKTYIQDVPFRPFILRWDGTDLEGQHVGEGQYKLVLRVRRLSDDRKIKPYPREICFTHKHIFH